MLIDVKPGKVFELPTKGLKLGVLADIVYIKGKMTGYGLKDIARFIWLLEAKDSEGAHFRVMREVNQSMADNSSMYALITEIRGGTPPPVPYDPDVLIGTSSIIGITRTSGVDKRTGKPREYAAGACPSRATWVMKYERATHMRLAGLSFSSFGRHRDRRRWIRL